MYIYRTRGGEISHYLYCVWADVGVAARKNRPAVWSFVWALPLQMMSSENLRGL